MRELSKKNKYYIPKDRFKELQYFCRQYAAWIAEANIFYGMATNYALTEKVDNSNIPDSVSIAVERRKVYLEKTSMISTSLDYATRSYDGQEKEILKNALFYNVTKGYTYERMCKNCADLIYICPRNKFYQLRQEFFWNLDKLRR